MGKETIEKIIIAIITTILGCSITFIIARGQIINKKADYEYVDKRDTEVKEEIRQLDIRNDKEHDLLRQSYEKDAALIRESLKEIKENLKENLKEIKKRN